MGWLRCNWRWILACSGAVVGLLVMIGLYAIGRFRAAKKIRAAMGIALARAKVESLEATAEYNRKKLGSIESQEAVMDSKIKAAQEELENKVEQYTTVELADEFKRRGY